MQRAGLSHFSLNTINRSSFRIQCRFKGKKSHDEEIRAKRDYIQEQMQKQRMQVQTKKMPASEKQDEFDKIIIEKFPELKKIENEIRDKREMLKEKRNWKVLLKYMVTKSHASKIFYLVLVVCMVASMLVTTKKTSKKLMREKEINEKAYEEQVKEIEEIIAMKKSYLKKE